MIHQHIVFQVIPFMRFPEMIPEISETDGRPIGQSTW